MSRFTRDLYFISVEQEWLRLDFYGKGLNLNNEKAFYP
jgi:hypothetical protein